MSELEAHGLNMHDAVDAFWTLMASRMKLERMQTCRDIASGLEDEYGCISIGSMLSLHLHDAETLFEKLGGKRGWTRTVEHILGKQFKRLATSGVPDSAKLGEPGGTLVQPRSARFPKEPLGAYLTRAGKLDELLIPEHVLDDAITETRCPSGNTLSKNDKKAVCCAVWCWLLTQYAFVGNCIILFKHLAKQLKKKFPFISGAVWHKSLGYRAENGRRPNAIVRHALPIMPVVIHTYIHYTVFMHTS